MKLIKYGLLIGLTIFALLAVAKAECDDDSCPLPPRDAGSYNG